MDTREDVDESAMQVRNVIDQYMQEYTIGDTSATKHITELDTEELLQLHWVLINEQDGGDSMMRDDVESELENRGDVSGQVEVNGSRKEWNWEEHRLGYIKY